MNRRTQWRRKMYLTLEEIRTKGLKCKDHPNGVCEITYHPPSKSWLIHCMEEPEYDKDRMTYCFAHEHFDPSDWANELGDEQK